MECKEAFLELTLCTLEPIIKSNKYCYYENNLMLPIIFPNKYILGKRMLTCQKLSTIGNAIKKASLAVPDTIEAIQIIT